MCVCVCVCVCVCERERGDVNKGGRRESRVHTPIHKGHTTLQVSYGGKIPGDYTYYYSLDIMYIHVLLCIMCYTACSVTGYICYSWYQLIVPKMVIGKFHRNND